MNGICHILDCHYGTQENPGDNTWAAIKVRRDGNPIIIDDGFATEEEAEAVATAEHERDLKARAPDYRFKFQIIDENTGDVIVDDYCSFETVDEFGGCEAVDHQTAKGLRYFKRVGRAKHEAENYPKNDQQRVTQLAGRIRAVVES